MPQRISFIALTLIISLNFLLGVCGQDAEGIYNIGTGIADATGPAAGVVLNGYVNPFAYAAGVHTRLHARSFIVESLETGKSVVFVSCDLAMFDHGIKLEVIKKLRETYGEKYTEQNVQISTTHTHSGPSGYMQYYSYLLIESQGFNPLSFWAIVDGVVESIAKAHDSLTRGRIRKHKGELIGYNGNRRQQAYDLNPEDEKNMYTENVDKDMVLLRFDTVDEDGQNGHPLACFIWWPVHPISFNGGDNPLVSSDSRGYASVMFDYQMNTGESARPGRGKFVAAFAATNLGDVSPRRPGRVDIPAELESVRAVAMGQFEKAFELFNDQENMVDVKGPVNFIQQYVDLSNIQVTVRNSTTGEDEIKTTCKAGLGYSFVGMDPAQKELWDFLQELLNIVPSEEMVECHKPKLVALPAGEITEPWDWAPSIADLNILQVGNVDLVSAPGEFTTMSGRRLRRAIEAIVPSDHEVVIAGLSNNYINYIATPEEYDLQEYEAGATIFGPYTLNAIIQSQVALMNAMINEETVERGPTPTNFIDRMRPKIPDRVDRVPVGRQWGEVFIQPREIVRPGETLVAVFVTPSLRHNALRNGSHFLIERRTDEGDWETMRTDADLDTTFWWNAGPRAGRVTWFNIPEDVPLGTYRIYHSGYFLNNTGEEPKHFEGYTELFEMLPKEDETTVGLTAIPTTVVDDITTINSTPEIPTNTPDESTTEKIPVSTPEIPSNPTTDDTIISTIEITGNPTTDDTIISTPEIPSNPTTDDTIISTPEIPSNPTTDDTIISTPEIPSNPTTDDTIISTPEIPSNPTTDETIISTIVISPNPTDETTISLPTTTASSSTLSHNIFLFIAAVYFVCI